MHKKYSTFWLKIKEPNLPYNLPLWKNVGAKNPSCFENFEPFKETYSLELTKIKRKIYWANDSNAYGIMTKRSSNESLETIRKVAEGIAHDSDFPVKNCTERYKAHNWFPKEEVFE